MGWCIIVWVCVQDVWSRMAAAPTSNTAKDASATATPDAKSADNTGFGSTLPRCRQQRSVPRTVLNHNLGAIRDAPAAQREDLLIKKIRLCCYIFNYSDAGAAVTSTEAETLQDTKGMITTTHTSPTLDRILQCTTSSSSRAVCGIAGLDRIGVGCTKRPDVRIR